MEEVLQRRIAEFKRNFLKQKFSYNDYIECFPELIANEAEVILQHETAVRKEIIQHIQTDLFHAFRDENHINHESSVFFLSFLAPLLDDKAQLHNLLDFVLEEDDDFFQNHETQKGEVLYLLARIDDTAIREKTIDALLKTHGIGIIASLAFNMPYVFETPELANTGLFSVIQYLQKTDSSFLQVPLEEVMELYLRASNPGIKETFAQLPQHNPDARWAEPIEGALEILAGEPYVPDSDIDPDLLNIYALYSPDAESQYAACNDIFFQDGITEFQGIYSKMLNKYQKKFKKFLVDNIDIILDHDIPTHFLTHVLMHTNASPGSKKETTTIQTALFQIIKKTGADKSAPTLAILTNILSGECIEGKEEFIDFLAREAFDTASEVNSLAVYALYTLNQQEEHPSISQMLMHIKQDETHPMRSFLIKIEDKVHTIELVTTTGVEIEYFGKNSFLLAEHLETIYGWHSKEDETIEPDNDQIQVGIETVSPILKNTDDLKNLILVATCIQAVGGQTNDSCGFHLHKGIKNLDPLEYDLHSITPEDFQFEVMKQMVINYVELESIFDSVLRADNKHAGKLLKNIAEKEPFIRLIQQTSCYQELVALVNPKGRTSKVNLVAFADHDTVELRQREGTVDTTEIIDWIETTDTFTEESIKQVVAREKHKQEGKDVIQATSSYMAKSMEFLIQAVNEFAQGMGGNPAHAI